MEREHSCKKKLVDIYTSLRNFSSTWDLHCFETAESQQYRNTKYLLYNLVIPIEGHIIGWINKIKQNASIPWSQQRTDSLLDPRLPSMQNHPINYVGSCDDRLWSNLRTIGLRITHGKEWKNRPLHTSANQGRTLSQRSNQKSSPRLSIKKSMGLWIYWRGNLQRYRFLIDFCCDIKSI